MRQLLARHSRRDQVATVRIWNADAGSPPVVYSGFGAFVEAVAISGDQRLLTTHGDGTARVWHCSVCGPLPQLLATARAHLTRALTTDERRVYLDNPTGG